MSALGWVDRTVTIALTALATSALWYAGGAGLFDLKRGQSSQNATIPAAVERGRDSFAPAPDPTVVGPTDLPEELSIPVVGVDSSQLTDTFFDARGNDTRVHEALDIMATRGTPVVAAAPGFVERLFRSEAGGLTIYVRSPDRQLIYYYAHLDSYAPTLREGQRVERGDFLGNVGSSGNASEDAPHLHFAILRTTSEAKWWEAAEPLNPYVLLTRAAGR